ncbi:aminoglycoside phosphotransferase family protein [Lentzea sp. JNUCC 0626]|uniref:aminoglycoside phosphotransferase family protein n=1 Tax=Lentzea sp. JNUCC 0626 TaxID=3367513 RepID=UPI00374A55BA
MTHADAEITGELVTELLRDQHPDLAGLPLRFGARGWDNQLWRLGDDYAVRLPWATEDADELLLKEFALLPGLAPGLPLPIPVPHRLGRPSARFPRSWIVTTWLAGEPADRAPATWGDQAADTLAAFLTALHRPAAGDVPAGRHLRGGPLARIAAGFGQLLDEVIGRGLLSNNEVLRAVWADALKAGEWEGPPVLLHGDLHPANVLTDNGDFCGVIDFGDLCAGDPACDLAGGWLLLPGGAFDRFRRAYASADEATWRRARGWALVKSLACLVIGDDGARGRPGGKATWGPPALAALHRLAATVG